MKPRRSYFYVKSINKKRLALAALAIALLLTAAVALAEVAPAPTPVDYQEYNDSKPEDNDKIRIGLFWPLDSGNGDNAADILYQVRQNLKREGCYDSEPNFSSNMLDWNDMGAIQQFWTARTNTDYPTSLGLTYGAMYMILEPPAPTEAPHEYRDIPWQQGSPDLSAMLNRLYALGYINDRSHTVYNEEVRQALGDFCENNGFPGYFDGDGDGEPRPIGVDIQQAMLETSEKSLNPKPEEAPVKVPYFLTTVNIAGLKVPMLALWGVGLAVLVAGVLAAIRLFMPADKDGKERKNKVHFSITYAGKTTVIDAEIAKTLKIGRGIGNFPLNLEDSKISRKHCELYYLNDALMLRDYSSNGTTVNGKPVHNAECMLSSGDEIIIGSHTITVKF